MALSIAAVARAAPCHENPQAQPTTPEPGPVLAHSLLGEPLRTPPLAQQRREQLEVELAVAEANHDADPSNEDAIIWLGRRLSYLHRYDDAIRVYTNGLAIHPDSARLLRHRGHRYLTLRRLQDAESDLARAAELIKDKPDEIEPDGQPNTAGIPTSTLQSNIYYHLGLARYLTADYDGALSAYRDCLRVSRTPDMHVAASYWLYLTLRRVARDDEAAEVLAAISADMPILENHDYHRLLLLFKNERSAEDVMAAAGDVASVSYATTSYGVGVYHLLNARDEQARRHFDLARAGGMWPAFGHLAAEAEVARLTLPP